LRHVATRLRARPVANGRSRRRSARTRPSPPARAARCATRR
jgi:hypothetical protein